MVTRRNFLKSSAGLSALAALPLSVRWSVANAQALSAGRGLFLSDPAGQLKFVNPVPDALDPGFKYTPDAKGNFKVELRTALHQTGLRAPDGVTPLTTSIWGYADRNAGKKTQATWPGKTFEVQSGPTTTQVKWENRLEVAEHLLPVDTNLHWCYSLHGYAANSIAANGVPAITHLHGGHSDFQYDGNPEFFSNPYEDVIGPQWGNVPKGFTTKFIYDNNVPAGNLWYHDHALGITRLNVYAGLAGFYFVRDGLDTGQPGNPLGLPAWPYEKAYAIQDRMFEVNGKLFYPAYPGDPFYEGFIEDEGANLPLELFPNGGPTGLAEFFGDHMIVNGIAWPREEVEARSYRLRLLNGTDSRFMGLRFRVVDAGAISFPPYDPANPSDVLGFHVIGSDQGLTTDPVYTTELVFEPGARYDVVINFDQVPVGSRVIMENYLGDAPFGGDLPDVLEGSEDIFPERQTDRVMAFDVIAKASVDPWLTSPLLAGDFSGQFGGKVTPAATRVRKVALFEGKDEFGRLQPLLGTAEPATDYLGNPINWPIDPKYSSAGLVGQIEGSIAWHSPTTENPALNSTEEWEIWNGTGDAHPVHVHLVHFEVLGRQEIVWDSNADEDGLIPDGSSPAGDGTYKVMQPTVQHNSVAGNPTTYGMGFKFQNLTYGPSVATPEGYVENAPKDMVIALPGQVTRIKATFDKPGRYVWHCHILSHEDHEMMRVMHVGPGA